MTYIHGPQFRLYSSGCIFASFSVWLAADAFQLSSQPLFRHLCAGAPLVAALAANTQWQKYLCVTAAYLLSACCSRLFFAVAGFASVRWSSPLVGSLLHLFAFGCFVGSRPGFAEVGEPPLRLLSAAAPRLLLQFHWFWHCFAGCLRFARPCVPSFFAHLILAGSREFLPMPRSRCRRAVTFERGVSALRRFSLLTNDAMPPA